MHLLPPGHKFAKSVDQCIITDRGSYKESTHTLQGSENKGIEFVAWYWDVPDAARGSPVLGIRAYL